MILLMADKFNVMRYNSILVMMDGGKTKKV